MCKRVNKYLHSYIDVNRVGVVEARATLKSNPSQHKSQSTKKSSSKARGDYGSAVTKESSTASTANQPSHFMYR